jgi:hypothetical protein
VAATQANDAALDSYLKERLQECALAMPDAEQERFDHCIDAFLGRRRIYTPQPTSCIFRSCRRASSTPRGVSLARATRSCDGDIREEFERVFAEDAASLEPYVAYPQGVPLDQWAELNHSRRWSVFYLWRDGKPQEITCDAVPRTAQVLASLPLLDIQGYAPTVFFRSSMRSRTFPRTQVSPTRASSCTLPLIIPPGCRFRSARRRASGGRAQPGCSTTRSSTRPGTTATCRAPFSSSTCGIHT